MRAPDRLIAWPAKSMYQGVSLAGGSPDTMVEYVRADLCAKSEAISPTQDERVKALVLAVRELRECAVILAEPKQLHSVDAALRALEQEKDKE